MKIAVCLETPVSGVKEPSEPHDRTMVKQPAEINLANKSFEYTK